MAKLSVVVPSNEVEVGSVKYRKVERKAQAGDIVKVLVDDYIDVEMGAYYAVINKDGETGFYDNDGDFRDDAVQYYPKDFEVYEKVTESVAVEYREVKRVAQVGDRIRIVKCHYSEDEYENGAEFIVIETHSDGDVRVGTPRSNRKLVLLSEYAVLEPVNVAEPAPRPERLKVGELARTLVGKDVPKGAIVRITRDDRSDRPYRVELLDGSEYDWYAPEQLEKVSEEEAKWAAIGRKVGEYKRGDIVEAKQYSGRGEQIYGKIEDVSREGELLGLRLPNGRYNAVYVEGAKLIVPVGQRFDKEGEVLSK